MSTVRIIETTARDWQAIAWARLDRVHRLYPELRTLDDALAHRLAGRVVRAHAAQIKREHEATVAHARRIAPTLVR